MLTELQSDTTEKIKATLTHLRSELAKVRTGSASPAMVEDLAVAAYEGEFPLKELASITCPEPNQLLVTAWDASVVPALEKALRSSGLGLSPAVSESSIRVSVPLLSEERRQEMIRLVGQKVEEVRVVLRNVRHEKFKSLDEMEKEGVISEDERDRVRKEMQRAFDDANKQIELMRDNKVGELSRV